MIEASGPTAADLPRTDFAPHSHDELVRMLSAGRPDGVHRTGDAWHQLGRSLYDRADDIERQLARFAPLWSGGAADQYRAMMRDLVTGIRTVAGTALSYRDLVQQAGDSLRQAQTRMPAAVTVTPVDATVAALAAGSLPTATAAALWESVGAAGRATLMQQVQTVQQQTASAGNAHAEAVRVMTELAGHYVATQQAIPATPAAAITPTENAAKGVASVPVATTVTPAPEVATTTTTTTETATTSTTTTPPLFSGVYTAGAVAAGAAAGGLFRGAAALANKLKSDKADKKKAAASKVGGIGGGGTGGGGTAAAAVGSSELTGSGGGGGSAGTAVAAATGAAAGAASRSGMGLAGMPMMPMSPMGGEAGAGGGRRIPPWLVETEDVWGESVAVTPPVIGEDPPAPRGGRRAIA